jgi:hypothetical protein
VPDGKERVIEVYIKRKPITDTEVPPMLQLTGKDPGAAPPQPGAAEPAAQNSQAEKPEKP